MENKSLLEKHVTKYVKCVLFSTCKILIPCPVAALRHYCLIYTFQKIILILILKDFLFIKYISDVCTIFARLNVNSKMQLKTLFSDENLASSYVHIDSTRFRANRFCCENTISDSFGIPFHVTSSWTIPTLCSAEDLHWRRNRIRK